MDYQPGGRQRGPNARTVKKFALESNAFWCRPSRGEARLRGTMTGISASDGRSQNKRWWGHVLAVCVPLVAAGVLWLAGHQPAVAQSSGAAAVDAAPAGGPIRLRQPGVDQAGQRDAQRQGRGESESGASDAVRPLARPVRPSDFEMFVRRLAGNVGVDAELIRRLGAELMTDWTAGDSADGLPKVPADYLVSVGDELLLTIWGTVDADLRLVVDRSGQVSIPRVGSVPVAGVRFADLNALLTARVGQVFKNFQLNTTLGRIRQVRVYVTGFADKPGAYQVSGLSTIVNALVRAGGPSAAGSYRNIQLRRGGKVVTTYDLYDLIVKGDTTADRPLQAEDVIHVNAVGTQVGLIGSVNRPGVFELKDGEPIHELMAMAGGMTAVADRTRLAIERLDDRNDIRIVQVALPSGFGSRLNSGDVLRV
ncbi:MAG: SLBB domain-containing protein, partial [Rubrivivax sp.]